MVSAGACGVGGLEGATRFSLSLSIYISIYIYLYISHLTLAGALFSSASLSSFASLGLCLALALRYCARGQPDADPSWAEVWPSAAALATFLASPHEGTLLVRGEPGAAGKDTLHFRSPPPGPFPYTRDRQRGRAQ
jgi:hypothetical protein